MCASPEPFAGRVYAAARNISTFCDGETYLAELMEWFLLETAVAVGFRDLRREQGCLSPLDFGRVYRRHF